MCSVVSTLRAGSEGELVQIRPPQPKFLLLNHFRNPAPIRICMPQRRAIDKFSVCPYSVQTPSQARRSLPTSRLHRIDWLDFCARTDSRLRLGLSSVNKPQCPFALRDAEMDCSEILLYKRHPHTSSAADRAGASRRVIADC